MKTFYYLHVILLIISTLCFTTCNIDDDPVDDQDIPESIISSKTAVIGAQGGTLVYDDGTTLVVPKGVLTTDYTVTISKIANEQIFGSVENRNYYDISGLPIGTKVDLTFPCPLGKDPAFVGILNYDPETYEMVQPEYDYDSEKGLISVSDFSLRDLIVKKKRWIVEWGDKMPEKGATQKILEVPFYNQISGTCWAASSVMLAKTISPYTGDQKSVEIPDFLRDMELGFDTGIGVYSFMKVLPGVFQKLTNGGAVKSEFYWSQENCFNEIVKIIDAGKPCVLYMAVHGHAVLVVGYKTVPGQDYSKYGLYIHDPNGYNPPAQDPEDGGKWKGGMYWYRPFDWFHQGYTLSTSMLLIPADPMHSNTSSQTIGFPSLPFSDGSLLSFKYYKEVAGTISIKWDSSEVSGYKWMTKEGSKYVKTSVLPETTKSIEGKINIWNADLGKPAECLVNLTFTNTKTGKVTYSEDYQVTIATDKSKYVFTFNVDTTLWLKNNGDVSEIPFNFKCSLKTSGGDLLDSWEVDFKIKGAQPGAYNYIRSYMSPKSKIYMYNSKFLADLESGCTVTGGVFRIMEETNMPMFKKVVFGIPKITDNKTVTYNVRVRLSALELNPAEWNEYNLKNCKALIKEAQYYSNGYTSLNTSGDWTIPITIDKNSKNKTISLDVILGTICNGVTTSDEYGHGLIDIYLVME